MGRIISVLRANEGRFLLSAELAARIYTASDGGPINADNIIRKTVHQYRGNLGRLGVVIESKPGKHGGFRLVREGG
jgi:hypothetical protein